MRFLNLELSPEGNPQIGGPICKILIPLPGILELWVYQDLELGIFKSRSRCPEFSDFFNLA